MPSRLVTLGMGRPCESMAFLHIRIIFLKKKEGFIMKKKKKSKHATVVNTERGMTIHFDPLFTVKATRRRVEMNTATKVEQPKKGKGSYKRHPKHKEKLFDFG
jgi:stalled ribosome alternative rescue factor ArfA